MNICIVGVGAIGGFIGTLLAQNKNFTVSAIARDKSLKTLQKHGWRLKKDNQLLQLPVTVTDKPENLGIQDIVIISLKAPALSLVLPSLKPLLGKNTLIVPTINGVPWWFCDNIEKKLGHPFHTVNPNSINSNAIPYENIIGAVIHASASRLEPGLIQHKAGNRIIIGEPNGGKSDRAQSIVDVLTSAGFDAIHSDNIRSDIWYKLWGNMTMNPVSAITGSTTEQILSDPLVRQFCSAVMTEAANLGLLLNCNIEEDIEQRHAATAKLGPFKTSMLQDVENHQTLELDGIVGIVHELAQHFKVKTPNIDALFGLARLFAKNKGLYQS